MPKKPFAVTVGDIQRLLGDVCTLQSRHGKQTVGALLGGRLVC